MKISADNPWIGDCYATGHRTLVLGESFYDDYPDEIRTDHGYVSMWLAGRLKEYYPKPERLYPRLANAIGPTRAEWWHSIAFTNLVNESVGPAVSHRPSVAMYERGQVRLRRVLAELQPSRVWIIGKEQSEYSAVVCDELGVPHQVMRFPTSAPAMSHAEVRSSWEQLQARAPKRWASHVPRCQI